MMPRDVSLSNSVYSLIIVVFDVVFGSSDVTPKCIFSSLMLIHQDDFIVILIPEVLMSIKTLNFPHNYNSASIYSLIRNYM